MHVNLGEDTPKTPETITHIGPGSLLWHYGGDMRIGFTGLSAGVLQLMHPEVGAGVAEHSNFFTEPWQRIERSLPWILGVIYDQDPSATGHQVRDFHANIKGTDHKERSYHALHPGTWQYTHQTFWNMVENVVDNFSNKPLNDRRRQQLYAENLEWYSRYGVSPRTIPRDLDSAQKQWDETCHDVLEMTPAAERALEMALKRDVTRIPLVPSMLWRIGRLPVSEAIRLVTVGGLPETVRQRFDIPWSSRLDQPRLELFQAAVRHAWPHLPQVARYHPRALEGRRRAQATRKQAA